MGNLSQTYKNRSKAREIALEYLYQWFLLNTEVCQSTNDFLAEKEIDNETGKYAELLIDGVLENKSKIDELISAVAKNWSIDRMIIVDRVILSIGTFEMIYLADIPNRVSINEAIELAKKYSTVKSFAFVNGLLDQISKINTPDNN
ncbi:MAG: transcription antitermination factor NusB [Candidatus Heimdallarchaeota archaeon]|nr:transcription antitermination factor NusB [Candidatus Heimdallarchaeota archaeon]